MKDKTTAILLAWIFFPALDFYLDQPGRGIAKLLTLGGLGVWALIDAIKITTMSDDAFNALYNKHSEVPAEGSPAGGSHARRWILIGIAAFGGLVVTCTVLVAVTVEQAVEDVQNIRIETCHYDATANMSVILEGTGGNSRSRTVTGNACD